MFLYNVHNIMFLYNVHNSVFLYNVQNIISDIRMIIPNVSLCIILISNSFFGIRNMNNYDLFPYKGPVLVGRPQRSAP